MSGPIERLYQRMMMLVGIGRITAGNDTGPSQQLQVSFGNGDVQDRLANLQQYGFSSSPQPGADAVVLFIGGNRGNGVVIATGDRRTRLVNLAPGEVALYTDEGDEVKLGRDGITIKAAIKLRIETPRLEVTGDIVDHCDAGTLTQAEERARFNVHHHGGAGPNPTWVP